MVVAKNATTTDCYSIVLVTLFEQFDAFPELTDTFMGIYPFRYITAGMAKYSPFSSLICAGVVEERRNSVPAVMGGVSIGADLRHYFSPQVTVSAITVWFAAMICDKVRSRHLHSVGYEWLNPVMYGYRPDAGGCLAPGDADDLLTLVDI